MKRLLILVAGVLVLAGLAACAPDGPALAVVTNGADLGVGNRMVLSAIRTPSNAGSDTRALFVRNDGSAPLTVTGMTISGTNASLFTASPTSFTLGAGETQ